MTRTHVASGRRGNEETGWKTGGEKKTDSVALESSYTHFIHPDDLNIAPGAVCVCKLDFPHIALNAVLRDEIKLWFLFGQEIMFCDRKWAFQT